MSSPPRVLFVTYGGGHVAMVIPVVRHLVATGLAEPTTIALTTAVDACRRAGVPCLTARDLLPADKAEVARLERLGERLTSGATGHPDIDPNDSVAYHGLSFSELVETHGKARADEMFKEDGRRAFLPIHLFHRLVSELKPDVVVATSAPRSERAAIHAASEADVPSCCIVNLLAKHAHWVAAPGFADRVCVLNEAVKSSLVTRGRDPADIVVTGNPEFDSLTDVAELRRSRRASQGSGYNVLWAANPEPSVNPFDGRHGVHGLNDRIAHELRRCAELHPDWTIVARPHPSEQNFAVEGPPNLKVIRGDPLTTRLAWADVVVTTVSTVGAQASLAGIPTVAVEGSVFSADFSLADLGLAHSVSLTDLRERLEQLESKPTALASDFAAVGKATERVAGVILGLVGSRRV